MQPLPEVRSFIVESFLYGDDDGTLTDDLSFLEKGIIDSTGILEVVSFIEEQYEISVEDEELIPDNFDSLAKVTAFVTKKRNNGAAVNR